MSFAGKWVETGSHDVKQGESGSERQRSHVSPHMWKLDLKDKCRQKYIYELILIYICIYIYIYIY
jgi:hypothetical protein